MAKIRDLIIEIGAKTDKLKAGLSDANRQVGGFEKGMKRLGGMIAGAFAIQKIAAFTQEVTMLAGEAQGVENAFARIGNAATLQALRDATRGTVSDLELMRKAVMASNFDIPVKNLASLFEFASRRAQETGQSVDYLVNSIVLGIGRKSPLILDNLGISAIRLREELKGTGVEMSSVADVATAVGKIATTEMSKMGPAIVTTKDKIEQMNASFENLKIIIGERVAKAFDEVQPKIMGAIDKMKEFFKGPEGREKELITDYMAMITDGWEKLSKEDLAKEVNKAYIESAATYQEAADKIGVFASKSRREQVAALDGVVVALEDYAKNIDKLYDDLHKKPIEPVISDAALGKLEDLRKKLEQYKQERDKATTDESIGWWNDMIVATEAMIKNLESLSAIPKVDFTLDINTEDITAITNELMAITPVIENVVNDADKLKLKLVDVNAAMRDIGNELGYIGAQQSESIQEFAQNAVSASKKIIAAYIAEGVAASIKGSLGLPPPFNLVMAGIAGGAAAALFNSLIPSFANEGQVDRPTMAMVGDYPGAASNPEFMLKKSTLKGLMNNGGKVEVVGVLKGRDIYWTNKNYSEHLGRTT